jgi:hypothetical protein
MANKSDSEIDKSSKAQILRALPHGLDDETQSEAWKSINHAIGDYRMRKVTYRQEKGKRALLRQVARVQSRARDLASALTELSGRAEKWICIELGGDSRSGRERFAQGRNRSHISGMDLINGWEAS